MKNDERGLIKMILLIIVIIVVISLLGFDLKNIFTSEQVQKNLGYVWNFLVNIWENFLKAPAVYLWGIWIEYIWEPFLEALESLSGGENPLVE